MNYLRRQILNWNVIASAAIIAGLAACAGEGPSSSLGPDELEIADDGPIDVGSRFPCDCIQDLFIEIGERVPGYGGFWMEGSRAVAAVTDLAFADTARAETRVFFHEERRERLGLTDEIRIVEVDHSFIQLAAWSDSALYAAVNEWRVPCSLDGRPAKCGILSGLGANEARNDLHIGVRDSLYIPMVMEWAQRIGIPSGALDVRAYKTWMGPLTE